MNTADIREMEVGQWLYWATALPVTALVILLGLWWMGELDSVLKLFGRGPSVVIENATARQNFFPPSPRNVIYVPPPGGVVSTSRLRPMMSTQPLVEPVSHVATGTEFTSATSPQSRGHLGKRRKDIIIEGAAGPSLTMPP
ncbi:hypothetical protein PspLS_05555 [Pyricularia sp. CBS 133598]|nr:hypothetical protein PspLS_05555 [Pyricularia sp. CBS 133598]